MSYKIPLTVISFKIDESLFNDLTNMANSERRSRSSLVRYILEQVVNDYLGKPPSPTLRSLNVVSSVKDTKLPVSSLMGASNQDNRLHLLSDFKSTVRDR